MSHSFASATPDQYSGGTPDFNDAWWYDPAGNRQPAGNHSYNVYNAANMLTQTGASYYTNDLNGDTLTGGGRTNVWDSQNRLVETTFTGVTTGFTYGPDGLRRTATNGGVTTQYILDGQNVAQEVSPAGTVRYIWGPRGPECRIDASGDPLWFLYDGHGNVIAEAGEPDENGNPVKGMRNYGPWGGSTESGTLESSLAYCGSLGHPTDPTGLIYMRARYYDPVLGRFISEDPAKDGGNWYLYAGGNPVAHVDGAGRSWVDYTVGAYLFDLSVGGTMILLGQRLVERGTYGAVGSALGYGGAALGGVGAVLAIKTFLDWAGPIFHRYVDQLLNEASSSAWDSLDRQASSSAHAILDHTLEIICGRQMITAGYTIEALF